MEAFFSAALSFLFCLLQNAFLLVYIQGSLFGVQLNRQYTSSCDDIFCSTEMKEEDRIEDKRELGPRCLEFLNFDVKNSFICCQSGSDLCHWISFFYFLLILVFIVLKCGFWFPKSLDFGFSQSTVKHPSQY